MWTMKLHSVAFYHVDLHRQAFGLPDASFLLCHISEPVQVPMSWAASWAAERPSES